MSSKKAKRAAAEMASSGDDLLMASVLSTAFATGTACILVEVIGARALAPFFGGSLMVWTAQISATLLFLALGYEIGGRVSRSPAAWHLPVLLFVAASWLALYPALRSSVLGMSSTSMGIASGSFLSGAILFGIPLLCIGAVSPVLVSYIDESRPGAGSAAGLLFFISTLGGLAGGWIAVFLVIPLLSVRICIVGTGVILALIGVTWSVAQHTPACAMLCVASLVAGVAMAMPNAQSIVRSPSGMPVRLLYSKQSDVGLVRVIDAPADSPVHRALLINGALQGGISLKTHEPYVDFIDELDRISHAYEPHAKDALLLGLGAGLLATRLSEREMHVTAVEIDPDVVYAARKFFDLPSDIDVRVADARSFLRTDRGKYDLIFLDVFAGENIPWYLNTVEMFRQVRSHLRPDGRLVINTITNDRATSPGLVRLGASLRAVFPNVSIYLGHGNYAVFNAVAVAGDGPSLGRQDASRDGSDDSAGLERVTGMKLVAPSTDDRSDIDYTDMALREKWRRLVINEFGPDILGD
jgi:spermidine synthase